MIRQGKVLASLGSNQARFSGLWSAGGFPLVVVAPEGASDDEIDWSRTVSLFSLTLHQDGWERAEDITDDDLRSVSQAWI